jgi:DNA-binding NarL/FixJ family response regulator
MQVTNEYDAADRTNSEPLHIWSRSPIDDDVDAADHMAMESEIGLIGQTSNLPGANVNSLSIGLIDLYRLTQECMTKAMGGLHPEISISGFLTVKDCIAEARNGFDLMVYYLHGNEISDATIMQTITTICQAFPTIPVIIFSDADRAQQSKIMRSALKAGARGFVPTQSASLAITLAAIRFVKAGGTFVPVDLLLTARPDRVMARQNRLTSRQVAVLGHLQQGKANKIIAYELGMSESTVKVHVRNIMRKMGATNRTQAAYKAQRLSNDFESARAMEI